MHNITTKDLYSALKKYFNFEKFRPLQEEIVTAITFGNDCLAILPTGGGKSLCFQLPGLLFPNITIVISPLISLMDDQVQNLNKKGIAAVALTSALSEDQRKQIEIDIVIGKYKFIYISPEKLHSKSFHTLLKKIVIDLVVVDEAHCISEWGHQFRPEYIAISESLQALTPLPIIAAFTASATPHTAADIAHQLHLNSPKHFRQSILRPNLSLRVASCPTHSIQFLLCLRLLRKYKGSSVIIYCATRQLTEEFAAILRQQGYEALPYHAGLSAQQRKEVQHRFLLDECNVICATTAFGMGVDKSNIRCVIHLNLPASLEGYYQEVGRAGRDGKESVCYLLSLPNDVKLQSEILENGYPVLQHSLPLLNLLTQKKLKANIPYPLRILIPKLDEVTQQKLPILLQKGEYHNWWKVHDGTLQLTSQPLSLRKEWRRMTDQLLHQYQKLKVMRDFQNGTDCRMKKLLWYFEPREERQQWLHFLCGKCDVCSPSTEEFPTKDEKAIYKKLLKRRATLPKKPPLYELCSQILSTAYPQPSRNLPGIGRGWRETITPQLGRDVDQQNHVDDSTRESRSQRSPLTL